MTPRALAYLMFDIRNNWWPATPATGPPERQPVETAQPEGPVLDGTGQDLKGTPKACSALRRYSLSATSGGSALARLRPSS